MISPIDKLICDVIIGNIIFTFKSIVGIPLFEHHLQDSSVRKQYIIIWRKINQLVFSSTCNTKTYWTLFLPIEYNWSVSFFRNTDINLQHVSEDLKTSFYGCCLNSKAASYDRAVIEIWIMHISIALREIWVSQTLCHHIRARLNHILIFCLISDWRKTSSTFIRRLFPLLLGLQLLIHSA